VTKSNVTEVAESQLRMQEDLTSTAY